VAWPWSATVDGMRRRARLGLVVAAIAIAVAAPTAYAVSIAVQHTDDGGVATAQPSAARGSAAVVPATHTLRTGRAHGVDVPLSLFAALGAIVLGAYWFALAARRHDRRVLQVVAFRRRGPPSLQFVM
jgi:hypothetical protein